MALPTSLLALSLTLLPVQDPAPEVGQYPSVDGSLPPLVVAEVEDDLIVQLPAIVAGQPRGSVPVRSVVGPADRRGERALADVPGRKLRFDPDLSGDLRFLNLLETREVLLRRERGGEVPEGVDPLDAPLLGEWSAQGTDLPVRIRAVDGRLMGRTSVDVPERPLIRIGGRKPEWLVEGSLRLRLRHEVVEGVPQLTVRVADGLLFVRDRLPRPAVPEAGAGPFLGTFDLLGQVVEVTEKTGVLRLESRGARPRTLFQVGPSSFRVVEDPALVLHFVLEGRKAVAVNLERYGSTHRCARVEGR